MRDANKTKSQLVSELAEMRRRADELEALAAGRRPPAARSCLACEVFQHTTEGFLVTDQRGTIQSVNPAFTAITGYTAEEAVGKNPRILKSNRHDAAFYQAMWASLLEAGHWKGEIWNRRKTGEAYQEWLTISAIRDVSGKITYYAAVFNDLTERERDRAHIQHTAYHDALTGLPNRTLFYDRMGTALAHAARNRRMLALLFIDLDNFKDVNDSFGHLVGDRLLAEVAVRFRRCVRREDTVARLGGDEFVLLMPHVGQVQDAGKVAKKILDVLKAPFLHDDRKLHVSASIGIAIYPKDGENIEDLVRNADAAMYRAKGEGRSNFRLFGADPELIQEGVPVMPAGRGS